jgi:hypothetical protein
LIAGDGNLNRRSALSKHDGLLLRYP